MVPTKTDSGGTAILYFVFLPIDLETKLEENDIAFAANDVLEYIPGQAFAVLFRESGCPAYNPRMMMKIILYAYTPSVFPGRKIEGLLHDTLRIMWLAQEPRPSYRTINRFHVYPEVKELLRQCFAQFRCQLVQKRLVYEEAIFIDGTKIEANVNGERNSYSKINHDATFMRMKDDYMKNGQLKAGYVQITTKGQYALAYDVFPNPTDTRTFIPFLDNIEEHFFELPHYIVAIAT